MPELPDIDVYIESLAERIHGEVLEKLALASPFFLRSAVPPVDDVCGREVRTLRRLGKRIAIGLAGDYWLVIHLMIAGRLSWQDGQPATRKPSRVVLASLRFSSGVLTVTEAGTKKRASLYLVHGNEELQRHDPGGLEVLACTLSEFTTRIRKENRTLKRALTDPRILSGVGNAYSDEILHCARLSPVMLTSRLTDEQVEQLYDSIRAELTRWRDSLRRDAAGGFPKKVTAFRPGMAVHGRYGEPCPVCATKVQRIRYASNETNYCPRCQTGGRLLADRALSRLLKKDWPRTVDELEKL